MKKLSLVLILLILFLSLILLDFRPVKSAPPEEATSPGLSQQISPERQDQIKELRERVATKVAELSKKMLRSWLGIVKSVSSGKISLTTKDGEKTILTNDQTKIFRLGSAGKKTIETSDLVVDEEIVTIGSLNQDTGQMTAKVIIAKKLPVIINGKVSEINKGEGTIKVQSLRSGLFVVDIEATTKILIWEKGKGLTKSGLSKIKIDDRVHVNGFTPTKPKEGENRITANRILVLPGKALGIVGSPTPTATVAASPTASPTPKPKASPTTSP